MPQRAGESAVVLVSKWAIVSVITVMVVVPLHMLERTAIRCRPSLSRVRNVDVKNNKLTNQLPKPVLSILAIIITSLSAMIKLTH